jgi:hypothetical protein
MEQFRTHIGPGIKAMRTDLIEIAERFVVIVQLNTLNYLTFKIIE